MPEARRPLLLFDGSVGDLRNYNRKYNFAGGGGKRRRLLSPLVGPVDICITLRVMVILTRSVRTTVRSLANVCSLHAVSCAFSLLTPDSFLHSGSRQSSLFLAAARSLSRVSSEGDQRDWL